MGSYGQPWRGGCDADGHRGEEVRQTTISDHGRAGEKVQ